MLKVDYEGLNKEVLEQRQNGDDSNESAEDESTQGSTSYLHKKVIFRNDTSDAWLQALGEKVKGRILGMRVGDDSMLSHGKKKGKEPRLSKEEFDVVVAEAVTIPLEALKNEQLEALKKEKEE